MEGWLVDGPLGLDRHDVQRYTRHPLDRLGDALESSAFSVSRGVRLAGEVVAAALLSLVLTFLFLKDGRRIQAAVVDRLPARHAELITAAAGRAWESVGGFLRGSAILGLVEGVIIGSTVALVGGALAVPVAVLTFCAAFFPIVGAVVAGAVAVLATLATADARAALIVLVVAVVVQQLDGDLLAPWVFGRAVDLHPAVVLVVLTAGGAVAGIAGAFIAVPITSAVVGVLRETWRHRGALDPP